MTTNLAFAAGSLWVTDLPAAVAHGCSVSRLDASSLSRIAVVAVPCSPFGTADVASDGAALRVMDTTALDLATNKGAVVRRIDPQTNQLGSGIPIPYLGGRLISSQGAVFYWNSNKDVERLRDAETAFQDLGPSSSNPYPAGDAFWIQLSGGHQAQLVDAPGGPKAIVSTDGGIVAGDPGSVFLDVPGPNGESQLWRQPADGSAEVELATAPSNSGGSLDYFSSGTLKFVTPEGFTALWSVRSGSTTSTLFLQWVPLP